MPDMDATPERLEPILGALIECGWCVAPGFLPDPVVADLRTICLARHEIGGFHRAGVGSGAARLVSELRGDSILWIEEDDPNPAVRGYLDTVESLRQAVNRTLYLGLQQLEAHFAVYPEGAFYKRHLDRFRDDDRRALTAILYLNQDWRESDGGLLRFWPDPSGEGKRLDIVPSGGTLVTFLSDRFWHEVLPARRQRLALTGWFKRR
jgi:SM-20-related protein